MGTNLIAYTPHLSCVVKKNHLCQYVNTYNWKLRTFIGHMHT